MNDKQLINMMDIIPSFTTTICCSFAPLRTSTELNQTLNSIIIIVGKHPNIKVTGIKERINIDLGALSRAINKLVDKGYIEKIQNTKDKREALIGLTTLGEEIFNKLDIQLNEHFKKLFNNLGAEDKKNLENALHTLEYIQRKMKGETSE